MLAEVFDLDSLARACASEQCKARVVCVAALQQVGDLLGVDLQEAAAACEVQLRAIPPAWRPLPLCYPLHVHILYLILCIT